MSGYGRSFRYRRSEFGSNTKGHSIKAFGNTTGQYFEWNAATNTFTIVGTLAYAGGFSPTDWTNVSVSGTLACSGSFAIATNKFTVAGTTGNTVVAGTLAVTGASTLTGATGVIGDFAVNTNKFNVTAASGNTAVAGTLEVAGASTLTGATGVVGDFAVNTNKFNVTAASGNTAIAGTLAVVGDFAINTNKFTVTASNGNTLVAGTFAVTGASALTGNLTLTNDLIGGELTDIAIHTDKFTVTGSNGNTAIGGTLAVAGATTFTNTVTVGVDGTGKDVTFYGDTSGCSLLYDESADQLIVTGNASTPGLVLVGAGSVSAAGYTTAGTAWTDAQTPALVSSQKYVKIKVAGTVYRIPLWADA